MQSIVFSMKNKFYAFNTGIVEEIIKQISSVPVPKAPEWVEGLINLRGNVVTLVDFSKFIHQTYEHENKNIIIIKKDDEKLGILVEEMLGVFDIYPENIQKMAENSAENVLGIFTLGEHLVNLIDITTIFAENEG